MPPFMKAVYRPPLQSYAYEFEYLNVYICILRNLDTVTVHAKGSILQYD